MKNIIISTVALVAIISLLCCNSGSNESCTDNDSAICAKAEIDEATPENPSPLIDENLIGKWTANIEAGDGRVTLIYTFESDATGTIEEKYVDEEFLQTFENCKTHNGKLSWDGNRSGLVNNTYRIKGNKLTIESEFGEEIELTRM